MHAAPEAESTLWRQASRPDADPPQNPLARLTSGLPQNPLTRLTSNLPQNPLTRLTSGIRLLPFLRDPDADPKPLARLTSGIRLLPLPNGQEKPPIKRHLHQSPSHLRRKAEGQPLDYARSGIPTPEGTDAFKPKRSQVAPDKSLAALLPAGLGTEADQHQPTTPVLGLQQQEAIVNAEGIAPNLPPEVVTEAGISDANNASEHVADSAASPPERSGRGMRRILLLVGLWPSHGTSPDA